MMVPKKSLILAGAALTLFGASASAQSQSGKVFARYNKPLKSISMDLATGTITHGPAVEDRTIATVVDFTNNDLAGFVGVDTGAGACMWIDSASKGFAGNASDLMNNVVFAYCSASLTPASGGPGGSVTLAFYEGYTVTGATPSTNVGTFAITGLPANTASSSFFGGFRCFFINLTFANLVCFADGNIGYSWLFTDLGTDGVLASTFPFLACIQSCSGIGPDAQGMIDVVDQYCPPGTLLSTFSFGTHPSGSYWTSISMDIREAGDVEAVATSWNSEGINNDILSSNAIVLGQTFLLAVDPADGLHGGGGPTSCTVRQNCQNGVNASSPLCGDPVELLTSGGVGAKVTGSHSGAGTPAPFPGIPVPKAGNLCGLQWAAQAVVVGNGHGHVSTARCGTVGTVDLVPDP